MRLLAILGACVAVTLGTMPLVVHAQTTAQSDARTIWEKFKGSWTQTKGAVKEQWGKLTDDDITEIEGRREQLIGKIQTRYGISREEAEAQVSGWEHKYRSL